MNLQLEDIKKRKGQIATETLSSFFLADMLRIPNKDFSSNIFLNLSWKPSIYNPKLFTKKPYTGENSLLYNNRELIQSLYMVLEQKT